VSAPAARNPFGSARHRRWDVALVVLVCATAAIAVPVLSTVTGETAALHVPDFLVTLVGKFTCYAIVAVALDLVWGYAGILSLCHGLFFALGGYAMGMYLMRSIGTEGMYRSELPDFMVFLDWKELPWYWRGFEHFGFAALMALVVPGVVAYVFGFFAFRSRITGVYFSIITQALTYAAMLLFFRNATGFGGNNGLTDFKRILGYSLREPATRASLCAASGVGLALAYGLCRAVVGSRAGRVLTAIRDAETKVRFCGYDPVRYKLFAWTLSAVLCGFAGALYVPQVGIVNPSEMQPSSSVEIPIWVAVGGRGSLAGAILGALLVNGAKSWLTAAFPTAWLYVLGALYVVVTLAVPGGILQALAGIPRAIRGLVNAVQTVASKRAARTPPASGSVSVVRLTSGAPALPSVGRHVESTPALPPVGGEEQRP
jgi:urea transport system permease protein